MRSRYIVIGYTSSSMSKSCTETCATFREGNYEKWNARQKELQCGYAGHP